MPHPPSAYDLHQQQRWLRHDAHLWLRHDYARWLPPGADPEELYPHLKRQREAAEAAKEKARAAEDAAFDAWIENERRWIAAIREEVDELKAARARRRLDEPKYSPDQPRVPAGNPRGGQFTRIGGGIGQPPSANITQPMGNVDAGDVTGSSDVGELFDIGPDETSIDGTQLAGDLPDGPKTPPADPPPQVPHERPDTREGRMGFVRDAAQWVARNVGRYAPAVDAYFGALDQVEKITALTDAIKSANDPAKTLEELQEPVGSESQGGYHDHHIVGQHAQNRARFGDSMIDSRENLVRIPVLKHIDISAWYQTGNRDFGGLSPRDYLRDKDWDEQMRVGLDLLRDRKVLK